MRINILNFIIIVADLFLSIFKLIYLTCKKCTKMPIKMKTEPKNLNLSRIFNKKYISLKFIILNILFWRDINNDLGTVLKLMCRDIYYVKKNSTHLYRLYCSYIFRNVEISDTLEAAWPKHQCPSINFPFARISTIQRRYQCPNSRRARQNPRG